MKEKDNDINKNYQIEEEMDLIEIVAKLWAKRLFIIKITAFFCALGLLIVIFTPNEYTASTTMVPQTGEKKVGGSLGGLAAIAGINLGSMSSGEVLSPTIYPKILNNIYFQKELIYSKYRFEKVNYMITYYEYLTNKKYSSFSLTGVIKKYTIGLPRVIIAALVRNKKESTVTVLNSNNTIEKLTNYENLVIQHIFSKLNLNINEKEGYISLSYTCMEPGLSAEVVLSAQKLLQKYITEFKIDKVRKNLEFVEKSFNEAKNKFELKQAELARFRDANKNISSAMARTQEEKLTSEYNLLLSIFTEIAKQKEQAKIAVTETTPILTIIEPVIIPTEKSGPRKSFILIGFIIFGLTFSAGWIIVKPIFENFICNFRNKNDHITQ